MRTLWNLLSFLAIVNLMALVIVIAWLWQSGRLTRARIDDIRGVLAMPESQAMAAAAKSVNEAEIDRLRQAEEQRRANPPTDSATQIQQIAFVQQQHEQSRRRLEDERSMLALQLAQATANMEANIAAFERQRAEWQASQRDDAQRKIDEQFLQAVKQLEQLPAKQAKGIIQQLVADNSMDQAVAYLDAMNPRAAAKVLREFKGDAEIAMATSLLERLRTFGLPAAPAADAPSDGQAGVASEQDSRHAATDTVDATPAARDRRGAQPRGENAEGPVASGGR